MCFRLLVLFLRITCFCCSGHTLLFVPPTNEIGGGGILESAEDRPSGWSFGEMLCLTPLTVHDHYHAQMCMTLIFVRPDQNTRVMSLFSNFLYNHLFSFILTKQ